MGQLINLKELVLNTNQLSDFPDFLGQLSKLEVLNLS